MASDLANVLIFLIIHLSFVRPAAVHDHIARPWLQASTTVTTIELTSLACAIVVQPLATTACRKRQLVGVVYALVHDDVDQFHAVNPTQVLRVEPSDLPVLNHRFFTIADFVYPSAVQSPIDGGPIQSTMRIADPYLLTSFFSSLLSNLFSGIQFFSSTEPVYTSTITSTVITATSTYTLSAVSCLPIDLITCPAVSDASIADVLVTEDPVTEDPVTEDPVTEDPVTDVL